MRSLSCSGIENTRNLCTYSPAEFCLALGLLRAQLVRFSLPLELFSPTVVQNFFFRPTIHSQVTPGVPS